MWYAKKLSDRHKTIHFLKELLKSSAHFGTKYDMIAASLRFLYRVLELYPIHIENLLTMAADTPECTKVVLLQIGPFQKQFYSCNGPD